MPIKQPVAKSLSRDSLRKIKGNSNKSTTQRRIAELGELYSIESRLLSHYINKLTNVYHIYPRFLPTQASFRCSTIDPPITNWPRACINTVCPSGEHEWTDTCFSVRDIIKPPEGYVMVVWDHDNIEGRIHDLIVNDQEALKAHREGLDLHTITCCAIFNYTLPRNLYNPHTAVEDTEWRTTYNWQGKDTKQRVLAKNFNHGSKYTETYKFVHKIQGIEQYGISYTDLEALAKQYIASKGDAWFRKLAIMDRIRKDKCSRTLYGAKRLFFPLTKEQYAECGRQGFSHMISGTVSHYNYTTLNMLDDMLDGEVYRQISSNPNTWMSHNAHDGDKVFIRKDMVPSKEELLQVIERDIEYEGRSIKLTAGVKVYG
jgi:hypothetical protein